MTAFVPPKGIVVSDKIVVPGTSGYILQVTCGIKDEWEPSQEELEAICDLFQRAVTQLDPHTPGYVIVTRRGVTIST